ncbi:MAG: hypothetical protein L7F78_06890, partial [Syntrophales bacterium LBB04]|nr:hypothetical protein [Syntrophales bacterium LBB04]
RWPDAIESCIKVIASEALLLDELKINSMSKAQFTIDINKFNADALKSLKEIITRHRGNSDGYIRLISNEAETMVYLGCENRIEISDKLKSDTDAFLGNGCTRFI